MGPDLTAPGTRTNCPSCGGRLRPDATFCGQCYADFRPAPPAVAPTAPAANAAYGVPAPDPLTAPLLDVVLPPQVAVPAQGAPADAPAAPTAPAQAKKAPVWPCSRCEASNELTSATCHICGAPFLAQVSEETQVSVSLPLVGDLSRYGRGQRALIALAAIMAILVPLALVTLLLTHRPDESCGKTCPAQETTETTETTTQ